MCGIVGYVGFRPAPEFLVEGLRRLEYRGYDSAGIAVQHSDEIGIRKRAGRVDELAKLVEANPVTGSVGIGHTRWATHGETTDVNSHPHVGGNGEVVIVHNGVIENYVTLRDQLQTLGYVFRTTTDSEIIAHMVCHHWLEQVKLGSDPESHDTCLKAIHRPF
jgi:glucosamine--fructose-6-phosphate aminotransferase (isomerizing)